MAVTLPCPSCPHRGPVLAGRTTCRAPRTEGLVEWIERIGEAVDEEARPMWRCPSYPDEQEPR